MANLLINIEHIKKYRSVSLGEKRCDPFILEAQENDIRPILNDALYFDFTEKVFSTSDPMYNDYQILLNGGTYTVNNYTLSFPGIEPMLCYFALSRIVLNNQINITQYGVVQKNVDESTPIDTNSLKLLVTELRSVAIGYQGRVVDFLENKKSTYPLYNALQVSTESNRTGLSFFSV